MKFDARRLVSWDALWFLAYALFVFDLSRHLLASPRYNWDLLPYTASVMILEHPADELGMRTFDTLRPQLSPRLFQQGFYRPKGPYGMTVATDPEALKQQLPFYQVKPLYIWTLWAMTHLGLPLVFAAQLISVASLIAVGIVLALWQPKGIWLPLWLAGSGYLLMRTSITAQLFTPDFYAAALALGACYAGVAKNRAWWAAGFFAAAILARPDSAPVAGLFFVLMAAFQPATYPLKRAAGCLGLCVLAYALASAPGYGWQKTFQHAFMGKMTYPQNTDLLFTWDAWQRITGRFINQLLDHGNPLFLLPLATALAGITVLCKFRRAEPWAAYACLGILAGFSFASKVLIFPMAGIRFHLLALYLGWVALGLLMGMGFARRLQHAKNSV